MAGICNIPALFAFLRELSEHNERPWFNERKAEVYIPLRKAWEQDIERAIALVAQWDDKARGLSVKDAAYRIYRDTRFSHDKTPYKCFFSAVIGKGGRHCVSSAYYLHFEPGHAMLCGGVWWPERDKLLAIRNLIDAEQDEFAGIVKELEGNGGYKPWPLSEKLKKVPREFDPNHPLAEYLKLKDFTFVKWIDDNYFDCDDWVERAVEDLKPLKPLHDFLDWVYDE